jgi:hypothetical protein
MKPAEVLTSHLGTTLFLATLYMCWLLKVLSRRMGEITRMQSHYKVFDLGNILILVATLNYILICSTALATQPRLFIDPMFLLFAFYIPLVLGIGANLWIAAIYWGWLSKEL